MLGFSDQLRTVDPEIIAYLPSKVVFDLAMSRNGGHLSSSGMFIDGMFSTLSKQKAPSFLNVANQVGSLHSRQLEALVPL